MTYLPFGPTRRKILFEVMEQKHPTVPSVALAAGCAWSTCVYHLNLLERAGLVAWEHGKAGTLRPLVRLEPLAASSEQIHFVAVPERST